jgi:hypothetical protein
VGDGAADLGVERGFEGLGRQAALGERAACVLEPARPQQAADDLGAKQRFAGRSLTHRTHLLSGRAGTAAFTC